MERLQNVVFPDREFAAHRELFCRSSTNIERQGDGAFRSIVRVSFDTYMNAFALGKWRKYTDVGDLWLCLRISGKATVTIYGAWLHSFKRSHTEVVAVHEVESDGHEPVQIALPDPKGAAMLYFDVAYLEGTPCRLLEAYYGTRSEAKRDVKIAILTPTYRREDFVRKNVERFRDFLEECPARRQAFHWYLVDNGRTLDRAALENPNITVLANKNTGCSGGVARGLIEVLRSGRGFTHVQMMDDDVEFLTESFARTRQIMRYVKEPYRTSFLHGSNLSTRQRSLLIETLACRYQAWLRAVRGRLLLTDFHNVLVNDSIPDDLFETPEPFVHSAWWYCCVPLVNVDLQSLPMPWFIRGDDIEFSWRHHGIHHITMNGVCVWHEARAGSVNPRDQWYFLHRNMFFVHVLHVPGFGQQLLRHYFRLLCATVLTYQYEAAEYLLRAMADTLRGPDCLREDPSQTLRRLDGVAQPRKTRISPPDEPAEHALAEQDERPLGRTGRLLYLVTLGGLLLPGFFFRRGDARTVIDRPSSRYGAAFWKRVLVFDFESGQCTVRQFDRWKAIRLCWRFAWLLAKLKWNYRRLEKETREAYRELTGVQFWQRYLELKPQQEPADAAVERPPAL